MKSVQLNICIYYPVDTVQSSASLEAWAVQYPCPVGVLFLPILLLTVCMRMVGVARGSPQAVGVLW